MRRVWVSGWDDLPREAYYIAGPLGCHVVSLDGESMHGPWVMGSSGEVYQTRAQCVTAIRERLLATLDDGAIERAEQRRQRGIREHLAELEQVELLGERLDALDKSEGGGGDERRI